MKIIHILSVVSLLATMMSADSSRAQKWEFFFTPTYIDSNEVKFEGGSKADINTHSGIGFGFGYNVNEHVELTMLFSSSNSNYKGTIVKDDGSSKEYFSNVYTSSFNLGATYNFIKGPLTPYVSGTLGSTYIDSGVATGDVGTGCYWDPWWGYICTPYAETYTSVRLNYGASLGVRYDFKNALYLKMGVGKNWVDFENASSNDFTVYDLTIGGTF